MVSYCAEEQQCRIVKKEATVLVRRQCHVLKEQRCFENDSVNWIKKATVPMK